MGNHDERAPYAAELFGEESDDDGPQDRVHDVDGLRIVALDTSVPGYHHGELTDDQLAWLRRRAAPRRRQHGTLLALHHPPIPVPMLRAAEIIELLDQHRLAEVIARHRRARHPRRALPLLVVLHLRRRPGLGGRRRPATPPTRRRSTASSPGVDGHQAVTMVHVYDDRVVHTIVPMAEAPEVSGFPADVAAQVEALTPEERREMVSRKDSPLNTGELQVDPGP